MELNEAAFYPKYILNYEGTEQGVTTGATRPCTMHGCTGIRIDVRWPNGRTTRPCSKGLLPVSDDTEKIG